MVCSWDCGDGASPARHPQLTFPVETYHPQLYYTTFCQEDTPNFINRVYFSAMVMLSMVSPTAMDFTTSMPALTFPKTV